MKVLIINPYFFSEYKGGVERFCQNLYQGLAANRACRASLITGHFFNFFGYPIPDLDILKKIKIMKPDLLHLQGPGPYASILGLWGKILGIETILTYYAPPNPKNIFKKILVFLDQRLLKYIFDYLTVISEDNNKRLQKFFPAEKITLLSLFLEDRFFEYPKTKKECREELLLVGKKIVLFVGRMDRQHYYKGVDILIRTANDLPDVKFILIGDGEKRKDFQALAKNMGLQERLQFVGAVGEANLIKYYRAADLLVLPSISSSEGFGYVILEAMALGLPVVTTTVTGSAEIIKRKEAGFLVAPNDPVVLKEAIKELLGDIHLYQRLQESGKNFAEDFRAQANVGKILDVYRKVSRD
jgi:glycosyltransferase involved in cell wall biosynthesis